jgi:hypothetical protein
MKALTSIFTESPLRKALADIVATVRSQASRALELHLDACSVLADAHERRVRVKSRREW